MIGRRIKQALNRILAPLAAALLKAGVTPNALTVAGLAPALAAGWLASQHRLVAAGLVLGIGSWLDLLDGAVARLGHTASPRGAFLDSTLDRVADAAVLGGMFWHLMDLGERSGLDRWGPHLAFAAVALGLVVPYIKARAQSLGYQCDVGLADRGERLGIVVLGLLFQQVSAALAVLAAVSAISAIQRFAYVWGPGGQAAGDRGPASGPGEESRGNGAG